MDHVPARTPASPRPGTADELNPEVRLRLAEEVTHGRTVSEWAHLDVARVQRRTRRATGWLIKLTCRSRAFGVEHIPRAGAFLLAANHSSWLDGWLQLIHQPRIARIIGKSEALKLGLISRFLVAAGVFPVLRGEGDLRAREILRLVLESGTPVLIYPEGTRKGHPPGELGTPKNGTALLALQTGVPVVPAATIGVRRPGEPLRLHWPKVTTVYGAPMQFEGPATPERVAEVTALIWAEIQRLHGSADDLRRSRGRRSS